MLDKRKTNSFFSSELARKRLERFYSEGDCYPLDIVIHPTTRCNHSCNSCYHQLNFKGEKHYDFDTSRFLKLLGELKDADVKSLIISGGGEPLKHRDSDIIIEASSHFPFSAIYTNLDFSLENSLIHSLAGLNVVNVNVSSTDPAVYKSIRGQNADINRVQTNLKVLANLQPNINGIITVRRDLIPSLEKTIDDLLNCGVSRIVVSPAFDLNYKDGISPDGCITDLERIKSKILDNRIRILEPEEKTVASQNGKLVCNTHFFDITIGANEEIYPCCNVSYLSQYKIVNLRNYHSFREAWKSKERKKWIVEKEIGCRTCWFTPANRVIGEKK
ncbi:MAG: radical SAM protein [Nanoarchaeota archaeon]|nr:radical SAM protein [Nanoarchaeota archaeon]